MATDTVVPPVSTKTNNTYVPYRATNLWNEVIQTVKSGLPIGRHRKQLKSYDNCFVASEAVTWLLRKLQENCNFGPQVTRHQTVQLLQKFQKAGLFEDVRGPKHNKDAFSDGGRLFKFIEKSPTKASLCAASKSSSRTPLATRTSLMNSDSALTRKPPPHTAKPPLGKGHSIACLPGKPPLPYTAPKTADLPRKHIRMLPQRSQSCRRERDGSTNSLTHVQDVKLTETEVHKIWKDVTLDSIKKFLQLKNIGGVLDSDCVNVQHLLHNMTQVNKNGLVTNIDKKDQLPHWIISAMRCLAYWPEKVEENLPDYPGFEKDVFKVIKEYFSELDEPLVTFELYEFFLSVMVFADSIGKPQFSDKVRESRLASAAAGNPLNLPSSTSVENLILDMTSQDLIAGPDDVLIINDPDVTIFPAPGGQHSDRRTLPRSVSGTSLPGARMETSFGIDTSEPQTRLYHQRLGSCGDDYGYHSNSQEYPDYDDYLPRHDQYTTPRHDPFSAHTPYSGYPTGLDNVFFPDPAEEENNYMYSRTFATNGILHDIRVSYPENDLRRQGRTNSWASIQSAKPHEDFRRHSVAPPHHQAAPPHLQPPYHQGPPPYTHNPPPYKPPPSYRQTGQTQINNKPRTQRIGISRWTPDGATKPHSVTDEIDIYRSPELASDPVSLDLSQSMPSLAPTARKCNLTESYRHAMGTDGPGTTPIGQSLYGKMQRSNSSPSVLAPLSRNRVYEVLQLCCLLLPPANRRKLHLLLRFMNKAANNANLMIDEDCTMKELVLRTFTRCILRSGDDLDPELLTQQIVTFMVEGYTEIMKVSEDLRDAVDDKILATKRSKIRSTWDSDGSDLEAHDDDDDDDDDNDENVNSDVVNCEEAPSVAYCQQVSMATYEKQRLTTSQKALHTLLDEIVKNKKFSDKDKRRHLKQFQKNHPKIYSLHFPTPESEAGLFSDKPQTKLSKPLMKLRSLRL